MGIISADTHLTPVKIKITLDNINFNFLHDLISQKDESTAVEPGETKKLVDTENLMDSTQLMDTIKNEIEKNAYRYALA